MQKYRPSSLREEKKRQAYDLSGCGPRNIPVSWSLNILTNCSISVPIHPCVPHFLRGNSRQPTPLLSLRAAYLPRTGFPLYPKCCKHLLCTNPLQDCTVSRPHLSQHFIATFLLKNLVRFIPFIQNSVVPLPASSVSKTKVTHNCIWKQAMKFLGSACLPATLADLNSAYNDLLFSN